MGLFDFLFGNKKKKERECQAQSRPQQEVNRKAEQNSSPKQQANNNLFSKTELENLIGILSKISYLFRDSQLLKSTGGGRNESMMSRLHSYVGILGYYYEEEYKYGKMSSIVDSKIASHYALVSMAMSDPSHRKNTVKDLANNWSDVLQVIFNMQLEPNPEGDKFKAMESDIKKVTAAFEKLSGGKCRKPNNPVQQQTAALNDKYAMMVKNATFNPFKITCEPRLQNAQQVPNLRDVFAKELKDLYERLVEVGRADRENLISMAGGYAFTLVESYYKNAGYVPKTSLDQILEQVYDAMQQSGFKTAFPTLDDYKYNCYYGFLNR